MAHKLMQSALRFSDAYVQHTQTVILVAIPASRGTMEKYQNRHLRQVEHAAKHWEAWQSKFANHNNRRASLERQNSAIYRNVYDRLKGNPRTTGYRMEAYRD